MTNYKNTNEFVAELLSDIENEFNSDDTSPVIVKALIFKLQALVCQKTSELQNESLNSVIFWLQESQARKMQYYCKIAKRLFTALKKELENMDFRSAWEMPIEA